MNTAKSDEEKFDVAIVGYGPVGATLAHLLGMSGLSVIVLEREGAAYHLPRAVQFDDEVMRVFQTIGLAELIGAKTRVNTNVHFVDAAGKMLMDWPRPGGKGHGPTRPPLWGGRGRAAEATARLRAAQAALRGVEERPEPSDGPGRRMGLTRVREHLPPAGRPWSRAT